MFIKTDFLIEKYQRNSKANFWRLSSVMRINQMLMNFLSWSLIGEIELALTLRLLVANLDNSK